MDNWWVALLFVVALLAGVLIVSLSSSSFFRRAESGEEPIKRRRDKSELSKDEYSWDDSGNRRDFDKAEYDLPEKDFFGDEKTELPDSMEDALSGLSEEEAEALLDAAGLLDVKPEEKDGR